MSLITLEQLIKWRREFHQYPEIGWSEFLTTAKIVKQLRDLNLDVKVGPQVINPEFAFGRQQNIVNKGLEVAKKHGVSDELLQEMQELTGCVAIFDSGKAGPTVALRFDIDCVGVTESDADGHRPKIENFSSCHPGEMHACGHDGHISIGLAVAHWLVENKDKLTGKVKLLFQPAEEGVRGARAMAESGIVDDVDYFLGAHLGFIANSGEIVINPTHFLCTTKLDFRFKGKPSHAGAEPELGLNALAGACHATTQMLGISRHGKGMSRINIGVLKAGEGRNVTPAYAEMQVEVRGENEEINRFMSENAIRMAEGSAHSFKLEMESEVMGEAVDLTNDKQLIDILAEVVSQHTELTAIATKPFGGSEDATILAKRVQRFGGKSLYFVVGADRTAGHHQSNFDFDEKEMLTAYKLYTGCLTSLL